MRKSDREVEQAALELRGRIAELVREFEAQNAVAVTEVRIGRVAIRTVGHISGPAVMDCSIEYIPAPSQPGQ